MARSNRSVSVITLRGWHPPCARARSRRRSAVAVAGAMRILVGIALLLLLVGCSSALRRGDRAWEAQRWDKAAKYYQEALEDGKTEGRGDEIRQRAETSRDRAADEYFERARIERASGDLGAAMASAQEALTYRARDDIAAELRSMRQERGGELAREGRAAAAAGDFSRAETALSEAKSMDSTLNVDQDLAHARKEAEVARAVAFAESTTAGKAAFEQREWTEALARFNDALQNGDDEHVRRLRDFCSAILTAESSAAAGQWDAAARAFGTAKQLQVAPDVIAEREPFLVERNYTITLHSAVILPFKPQDHRKWDGLAVGTVRQAGSVLKGLGALSASPPVAYIELATLVAGVGNTGIGPPDCYPIFDVDNRETPYRNDVIENSLEPSWNLWVNVRATASDKRALCANVAETPTPRMITVQGGGGTSDDEQPQHSAGGDPGAEGGRA